MVVKGDKDAEFGTVADLMTTLSEAKAPRFNLMTDLKRKEAPSPGARIAMAGMDAAAESGTRRARAFGVAGVAACVST